MMEELREKVTNFKNHMMQEIKNAELNIRDLENKIEHYYESIEMLNKIMNVGEEIEKEEIKESEKV